MPTKITSDALARMVALLAAISMQLVLLTLFNQRKERTVQPSRAMTLVRVSDRSKTSQPSSTEPRALTPPRIHGTVLTSSAPSSRSTLPIPQATMQFDTQAIAAGAVAKIIAEENRRHLDGRKPLRISEPTTPSIFQSPRHSLGDVEHDPASQETKVWHNDNCLTLIKPKEASGSSLPNYRRCMFAIGTPEPRGDLFEHLKKQKPLPEARPGVPVELAYPEER